MGQRRDDRGPRRGADRERYVVLAAVTMFGAVLDLFDFFLIAFIVPVVDDEWNLTFGQATAVLSAGVGAIGGALLWGRLGDRYGAGDR